MVNLKTLSKGIEVIKVLIFYWQIQNLTEKSLLLGEYLEKKLV